LLVICLAAGALDAQVLVTLSTNNLTLSAGQNATLTAVCTAPSGNTGVTWSVSPQVGTLGVGNNLNGTSITTTNNYQAPNPITVRQNVTITARSIQNPSVSDSVTIQLNPAPIVVAPSTITLNPGSVQQFSATGGGAGYAWSISPSTGSIDANGLYTAPSTVSASTTVTVTATSLADSSVSGTARITLSATPSIGVTISPTSASLTAGQTQQFTATVTNASSNAVIWSLTPQTGTIDAAGLYTAPTIVTASSTVRVTATAAADGSRSASATITLSSVTDIGTGAPGTMQQAFISAYFRNGFNNLVSLPPVGAVKRLGSTGYVQEFNDALKTGAKLALATLSPNAPQAEGTTNTISQLMADLYAYYTTVGANTAGLPLYDTLYCPTFEGNSCTYGLFDKGYALFAYHAALATGQNFTVRGSFYTEWTARLGISGPGRPLDVETAFTPAVTTRASATLQTFSNGAIYVISSGVNNAKAFTVLSPTYDLYISSGGPSGSLGLPVSQEITLSSGVHRQTFEGGILEYTPGSDPTQRLSVASIAISGAAAGAPVALKLGEMLRLTATPMSANGQVLGDRPVSWSTSNSKVVSIEATGRSAVLRATGGGVATVTATSEGTLSPKITVSVTAPCCQVGDGAPANVQQSFQDALTRNRLAPLIPVAGPAMRVGNGYVQVVQSADGGSTYWIAESDKIGSAFVVGGVILERYDALGGPAGVLGYPITDRSTGGTQRFEGSAALAGNPVRLVSGGVLTKWAQLGYESGVAGAPVSDAAAFATFAANAGFEQSFASATLYAGTSGPRAGQAYAVSGLILARYQALGGASGDFGMPASDEFVIGGVHQQNFEGGNITWGTGAAAAVEHPAEKTPGVIVSPASLTAGSRARLAVFGFPNGAALRVSITGQPDFTVATTNGAYSWEMFVPLATRSASLRVTAIDPKSGATASGILTIKGFNDNRASLFKLQGENQTGSPGALLPLSLRVVVRDAAGVPVTGVTVNFVASSGALLVTSSVTDGSGVAETWLRLPAQEMVTLVNVDAPGVASAPVTFAARSAALSLANFPKLQQAGNIALGNGTATIAQKGALLTAVTSILRYHQNRSELPGPNGSADPIALNTFLKNYCPPDASGKANCDGFLTNPDSGEQIVNLWRAAEFTGGADIEVYAPQTAAIADLMADGSPVMVSLALTRNGAAAGGHYAVVTGIAADGSFPIQDPSPVYARGNLKDYLNGFTLDGDIWKAQLRGVARFALNNPGGTRFLVASLSQPPSVLDAMTIEVSSGAGVCGRALDLPDVEGARTSRMLVCDGAQPTYQLRVGAPAPFRAIVDDLAAGGAMADVSGSQAASYKLMRPKLNLTVSPQDVSFQTAGVLGGATFTPGIAPGSVASIFGTGLAGPGKETTVEMDGAPLRVLFATPFQINAEVPLQTTPGMHSLRVQSAYGSAQQTVAVATVARGIFMLGDPPVGAMTNTSFGLIGATNPLTRGQTLIIWATGLGAIRATGGLSPTTAPVTVTLGGAELSVQYAGLSPGFPGLYQVNVTIPASTPPGLGVPLILKVGGQVSNTVFLSLQ
jgi:uncharacterized protein (TIGR03437 family)